MLTHDKVMILFFRFVCLCLLFPVYQSEAAQNNLLTLAKIYVKPGEPGTFGLSLDNKDLVTGVQVRFTCESMMGFQITGVTLTSRTTGYEPPVFQIETIDSGENEVLVVLYSEHGAAIIPGSGDILTFQYQTSSDIFGSSSLLFTETQISNIAFQPLSADFEDGLVSVYHVVLPAILKAYEKVPHAIPEPAALGCWLIGLFLIGLYMKKTRFD